MAKAGYCSRCGTNAWLTESGGCVAGHGPECVSGVYEAGSPSPAPLRGPGQTSSGSSAVVWLVVAGVSVLLVLFVAGILAAIAVPVFNSAKLNAQKRACIADMRVVTGAEMAYRAEHEDAAPPADWAALSAQICPAVISTVPACPAGGTYLWIPSPNAAAGGTVRCSIHGGIPAADSSDSED